ncbi:LysM peptidoglycan-binding domain-containing protein [Neobacillus kokaensis]|uniref:Uncharacterized protein n=1 Tax=Neobacillus kokaensis TaxID=2759023 RepID=A0ABQ3N0I1_9BACI|nr:LysM peptidoglycan-binding domain-containing protein [Neobacillus kokaensis]GHH98438.1 hypothetical protein AM1BK_19810 [Neobacillus kokaensis]
MTKGLFVNGELELMKKEIFTKSRQVIEVPVFTSRMQKREYYQSVNTFDIRNALDIKGLLKEIRANWSTYVSQVSKWIQKNPVKRMVVTGIFTVVFGCYASVSNAEFIQEYVYQVKSGEKIEKIAKEHGVTAQEILDANGLGSIDGKKILLPKVHNRIVTATILNIRSLPNTESSIIGKFKKGDVVKVVFVKNGWAGILIKGRVCFVKVDYLTQKQAAATITNQMSSSIKSQAKTMYVIADSLRVREDASISSAVVGSLKLNERVSVIKSSYGWAQIKFNGKTAFVNEAYLTNYEAIKTKNESNKNNSKPSEYVIKSGDTFTKIAKELGTSVLSIQELNPTADSANLKIGQKIKIPATANSTYAKTQAKTMYVKADSLRVREAASISSGVVGSLKLNERVLVLKRLYGWAQIKFNGQTAYVNEAYLTNYEPLKTKNESNKNSTKTKSSSEYVIKSGDTFTKIAKELGTSVSLIQELNPTADSSKLKIGQKIKIPTLTASIDVQIKEIARIAGIDPKGTFRFITLDGKNYAAKASGDMINELFQHQGEIATLTLTGKRGQVMTLVSLQ